MSGIRVGLVLAVVAALAAAFWFMDFRAATSDSRAGLQMVTMGSSPPGTDGAAGLPSTIALCTTGDADFAAGLRAGLVGQLRTVGVGDVAPCAAATPDPAVIPSLAVSVAGDGTIWTPVYAAGQLTVNVAYASDGDLSWVGHQPVVMPSGRRSMRASGSIAVDDTTRGLSSRPAYRRHLGEVAGAEIGRHFAGSLATAPATPAP